jgi:ADP-heptose:LPS heptosyltransferase
MSDESTIIMPEEIPDLARRWKEIYENRREPSPGSPLKRLRDVLRGRFFRRLARGHVRGSRLMADGRIDGGKIRRILIVRYDAIGDYICTTGLITWLRAAMPHAEIDMITSLRNDAVVRIDPNLTTTFAIDYQFKAVRPSTLEPLHRAATRDYDVVFGLATARMSKLAALISVAAPRAEKIVLRHDERAHIYGEFFTHQVERIGWLDSWANSFVREAVESIVPVAPAPPLPVPPYVVIGEEAWRASETFMRSEGLGFAGFGPRTVRGKGWSGPEPQPFEGIAYDILNISAFDPERQMSADLAVGIARGLLARDPDRILYVTGAPAEIAQIEAVVRAVASPRCRVLSLPLPQFFCVVGGASLVISPDTATVHIASAHGRPVVGLYSEKVKVAEWHPIGGDFALVLSNDERTINVISAERVVEAIERLELRLASSQR